MYWIWIQLANNPRIQILNPVSCRVMMYREHSKVVLTCRSQDNGRMVSGCTDGIIKVKRHLDEI